MEGWETGKVKSPFHTWASTDRCSSDKPRNGDYVCKQVSIKVEAAKMIILSGRKIESKLEGRLPQD